MSLNLAPPDHPPVSHVLIYGAVFSHDGTLCGYYGFMLNRD